MRAGLFLTLQGNHESLKQVNCVRALPTVQRQVLRLFLETEHCQRKTCRQGLELIWHSKLNKNCYLCTESIFVVSHFLLETWEQHEKTSRNTILCREPHSVLPQCARSTACSSPRGTCTVYISGWSWWNNITTSENTTSIQTGITNKINALWGILQ